MKIPKSAALLILNIPETTEAFVASFTATTGASSSATCITTPHIANKRSTFPALSVATTPTDFKNYANEQLASKVPEWVANLDYEGFANEVTYLGKILLADCGTDDVLHLEKIVQWRDTAAVLGVATMCLPPNPLTIAALSTWTYASWTMVAHHVCHGGYNRIQEATANSRWNSRGFALGNVFRRVQDWCDWMLPEAWNVEHNRLHHYHLGEPGDPDLVERNLTFLREMRVPTVSKYAIVAALVPIWKWFYYAPNTFKELQMIEKFKKEGKELPAAFEPMEAVTLGTMFFPQTESQEASREVVNSKEFFQRVLGPFLMTRFVLLPAPLLFIPGAGPAFFGHAVVNLIAAELLTNCHAFTTIVTNHAGNDLYKFDDEVEPKSGAFYVRQIVSSANYNYGNDALDFSHGWLNYQIEHHVWPDLSMLQYQKGAPKLRKICEKYGVPYVQESVWTRLRKTVDVMVGQTDMIPFPTEMEPSKDKASRGVTWKSSNGAIDED